MNVTELVTYAYQAMLFFAPPERLPQWPGYEETLDERRARYAEIATDLVASCADSKAQKSCVALLVALGSQESHWALDADRGPCFRGKYKGADYKKRCDSGHSFGVFQTKPMGLDADGVAITGERLFADRQLAARQVLRVARGSLRTCRHLPAEERLANLGGGWCRPNKSATARYRLWKRVEGFVVPVPKPAKEASK